MTGKIFDIKVLGIILGITFSLFLSITIFQGELEAENSYYDGPPRAAIIDQLNEEIPNPRFQLRATEYLEAAGYQVDLFNTNNVTVDFYKNLPKMNYEYVVVRTHGTIDLTSESVILFTGEKYTEDKYVSEQLFGQVKRATPLFEIAYSVGDGDSTEWIIVNDTYRYLKTPANAIDKTKHEFFGISTKFVEESMDGKFHGTKFILGGCDTMSNPSLAHALLERGASYVVGWDDTIGNSDNDATMLLLLETNLKDKKEMAEAVDIVSSTLKQERMAYPANIIYYSSEDI